MIGAILIKVVKYIVCEECGWVAEWIVSFCNLNVTKLAQFGSGVSTRTIGAVADAAEGSDSNMMTNKMSKEPSKSIYINHHLVTSLNDS